MRFRFAFRPHPHGYRGAAFTTTGESRMGSRLPLTNALSHNGQRILGFTATVRTGILHSERGF